MRKPPRRPGESVLSGGIWQHAIWVGLAIAGFSLFAQAYSLRVGSERAQTLVFAMLTVTQMAHVLAVRSETLPLWTHFLSNWPLLGAVSLTLGLQAAVTYIPAFQAIFHTVALEIPDLALVACFCLLLGACVETEKWLVRRGWVYMRA
jgi:Ca2+-transporting ATPase